MARFVRHAPCSRCGSRNNNGIYDDGSEWCFGCHHYCPPSAKNFIPKSTDDDESGGDDGTHGLLTKLLQEANSAFPSTVVEYAAGYGISVPQLLCNGGLYFPRTNALIFFYRGLDGALCCAQARSFGGQGKTYPKYFNWGSTYHTFDLIGCRGKSLVVTEDKLSAIKVSGVCDAIPALGTTFQNWKLVEALKRGYERVYVWLDKDKWREGREICDKAKWLGLSATALLTDLDPKAYSIDEIKGYLK